MNGLKRRELSLLLLFSIILGLMPQFTVVAHASGSVSYDPVTTDYAILNRHNSGNRDYYSYLVKNERLELYNTVSKFTGLSAGETYTRLNGKYTWDNFMIYDNTYTGYGSLASADQLRINLSATLHNDKHKHKYIHNPTSTAYQTAYINTGVINKIDGYTFIDAGTATQRLGDMEFKPMGKSNTLDLRIGIDQNNYSCNDGDCSIGDIVVAFADITDPKVIYAYTCDANGNCNSMFMAGNPIYLKVEFNEPIRFADNNASDHSDITAKMKDSNDNTLTGSLIALKKNYLMFEFSNTSVSGLKSKNITMTSVDLSALFGNEKWDLNHVKNGASINLKTYTPAFSGLGYTTSDSLITDIAGNSLPSAYTSVELPSACYVDGENPYVASITKTAQMNNGDVKQALGKTDAGANDYLDKSDIIAGVGDKITYIANFNEKLNIDGNCYSSNKFWGMKATLNVKDSSGKYMEVRSETMSQISGGIDLKNGASQGSITSVTFSPFTVTAGMTCDDPDGKINITSITPYDDSITIADLCGNKYTDSGNSWNLVNTNPYIMDITPPVVETSAGQSGSSYVPTTVKKDGSTITEYYFPITITDSAGTNGINGSFSWINNGSGEDNFQYEYAVTATTDEPGSWQQGTTGQVHSFTQVRAENSGNYIHIRLKDGEPYNLQSTSFSINATDYAGNMGTVTFALDYMADRVEPAASIASTGRSYDNSTGLGTFTAKAVVKDDGGLYSVHYLWVTDGSGAPEKDSSAWIGTGSFHEGDTSAEVTINYTEISKDSPFTGNLYIKAIDVMGNVSVSDLGSYTYDISAPKHTLTYTEEPTEQASLDISGLEAGNAAVVMIKKPGSTDGTYYVSVINSAEHLGDILNNNNISVNNTSKIDVYSWKAYKVTTDVTTNVTTNVTTGGAIYTFDFLRNPGDTSNFDYALMDILNGTYYGEIDVTVLTGIHSKTASSFPWTGEDAKDVVEDDAFNYKLEILENGTKRTILTQAGTDYYPVYAESITLKAAPGIDSVYDAITTTKDETNNCVTKVISNSDLTSNIGFDPDDSSDDTLSTLEGLTFNISLKNNKFSEWGISDIDFSKTYVSIIRAEDETGKEINIQFGDNLYLAPLVTQSITLPANDYPSGIYCLKLTVTSKTSGKEYKLDAFDTSGIIRIYVDATETSQNFGFAGFETFAQADYYDITGYNDVYYGPVHRATDADGNAFTQYTAADNTVYIPVNSNVSTEGYPHIYFTADDVSVTGKSPYYGVKAIKAWNVTSGVDAAESKEKSAWYYAADGTDNQFSFFSYYCAKFVNSASDVLSAYGFDNCYLPLIKNTLNTIAIQVVNANGKASEIRYAYIYPMDVQVSGTVSMNPSGKNEYVKEGKLTFTPGEGQSMNGVCVYACEYQPSALNAVDKFHLYDITASYDLASDSYSLALDKPGVHYYFVYTLDTYGNYTLFDVPATDDLNDAYEKHYWSFTDSGAPTVTSSSCSNEKDSNFSATYVFNEDTAYLGEDQKLDIYFDQAYMNELGFTNSIEAGSKGFELNLDLENNDYVTETPKTIFLASQSNPYGIYKVDYAREYEKLTVTIYGVVKYNGSLPDGSEVSHTLYATLEDKFGNISDPGAGVEVKVKNTMPKYVNGSHKEYATGGGASIASYRGLIAEFSTPVMLDKSIGTNAPSPYSVRKVSELPIFGDGTYDISFYDIFGTKWTQKISLTDVFKGYGLRVSLSDTDDTSEPVTVTITAYHPDITYFSVYESTNGTWEPFAERTNSTTFKVSANSEMHIVLYNNDDNLTRVDEMFYITNIINSAPKATVQWYYSEFKSDTPPTGVTSTTGKVTAWYTTAREVTPSGGTSASYTFYPGDNKTSYTFEYTDTAGNKGNVTATLPIALNEPPQPIPDTTAPTYNINICGMDDGAYYPAGYYSSTNSKDTLDSMISSVGYVQGYSFNIDVTEDSLYKIILLSGTNADTSGVTYQGSFSDTVNDVTLSGRTITVNTAAAFTVVIVDKSDNKTSFSMNLGTYLDNIAPSAELNKIYTGFYTVRTYIKLSDISNTGTDTGIVTLLSPVGLSTETDSSSPYYGQYYYDFADNKSLTITFRDQAGNKGNSDVSVDSINMSVPTASTVWSPYYYISGNSESGDPLTPPSNLTNKDVTAEVSYSKSTKTISTSISLDGGNSWEPVIDNTYSDRFTLKTTSDTATVIFHKGGFAIKLTATALNGKSISNILSLDDIIDKVGPVVNQKVIYNYNKGFETGMPYSATITMTPAGEDVYCDSATPGKLIKKDSSISLTVYKKGSYTCHFADIAGNVSTLTVNVDKDMDQTPPDLSVNTGDGTVTGDNVTASIKIDEDGTIVVTGGGKTQVFSGAVSKNTEKELTVANNGSYTVIACDKAGNRTTSAFVIGNIDRTAPVITLDPVTVDIRQDSNVNDLKTLLDTGCTVTDNMSDQSSITISYDVKDVKLDMPGVYKVTYTAEDEAQNSATMTRFVRVYSKDELEVLLNGKKTTSGGTTTLTSKTIKISLRNPLGDEPYTIYLGKGIKTEGQMKREYTIIKPDANSGFTVPQTGFYTMYIVTQSRKTYITKIYIEK